MTARLVLLLWVVRWPPLVTLSLSAALGGLTGPALVVPTVAVLGCPWTLSPPVLLAALVGAALSVNQAALLGLSALGAMVLGSLPDSLLSLALPPVSGAAGLIVPLLGWSLIALSSCSLLASVLVVMLGLLLPSCLLALVVAPLLVTPCPVVLLAATLLVGLLALAPCLIVLPTLVARIAVLSFLGPWTLSFSVDPLLLWHPPAGLVLTLLGGLGITLVAVPTALPVAVLAPGMATTPGTDLLAAWLDVLDDGRPFAPLVSPFPVPSPFVALGPRRLSMLVGVRHGRGERTGRRSPGRRRRPGAPIGLGRVNPRLVLASNGRAANARSKRNRRAPSGQLSNSTTVSTVPFLWRWTYWPAGTLAKRFCVPSGQVAVSVAASWVPRPTWDSRGSCER